MSVLEEKIKNHFDQEAKAFDELILKLIPHYTEMLEALVNIIPFEKYDKFKVVDLGCGTGTIAGKIKRRFSNAKVLCLDFAESMIEMAKTKLAGYDGVAFYTGDFTNYDFDEPSDVIVSSLALHHLPTDKDKASFYKKIFSALSYGGVFYNVDLVLASNNKIQDLYMEKWKAFLRKKVPNGEIEEVWMPKYYEEDRPASMTKHLDWLQKAGFKDVDVIFKYYNFAVYGGVKRS
ncbi:MAG TPA: class I SAM-dependent methyltransferase [Bacillota bacterium]|nr:class I SAM-dependent methyltransferase [Bacillota bacterium]